MKTRRGKSSYVLPAIGQINSIVIEGNIKDNAQNINFLVNQVRPEQLEIMRNGAGKVLGRIMYAALLITGYTHRLEVFPAPDEGGKKLRVRYFPPEREA